MTTCWPVATGETSGTGVVFAKVFAVMRLVKAKKPIFIMVLIRNILI